MIPVSERRQMKKELEKERVNKGRAGLPRCFFMTNVRCPSRMKIGIVRFAWNLTLPAGQLKVGSSAKPELMMSTLSLEAKKYIYVCHKSQSNWREFTWEIQSLFSNYHFMPVKVGFDALIWYRSGFIVIAAYIYPTMLHCASLLLSSNKWGKK